MALYKREKYSMLGSCLPTIVTMVVFFVMFAGFREMVGWKFASDYQDCYKTFDQSMTQQIGADWETFNGNGEVYNNAVENAQKAVYDFYYSDEQVESRSFLWIKNIFSPDTWSNEVPDYLTVTGKSGLATSRITGIEIEEYEMVMGDLLGQGGWSGKGSWNGWLLLPVLSLALNIVSMKLMSMVQGTGEKKEKKSFKEKWAKFKNMGNPAEGQPNDKPQDQSQASMKMMTYMMPVITAVFVLMSSSAFALYMFVSSLVATLFQLIFNLAFMIADKKQKDAPQKPKKVKANK
jgi:membrane protein insertase Oxa1/YidC/SpoIIIJ